MKRLIDNANLFAEVKSLIGEGHSVTLRATGSSMLPFIVDRKDNVRICPADSFKKYDIVLAETAMGHFVIHRIMNIGKENATLMGDGNVGQQEYCKLSQIIGKISTIEGEKCSFDCDSISFRWLSFLWLKLSPLRPLLLKFFRFLLKLNVI